MNRVEKIVDGVVGGTIVMLMYQFVGEMATLGIIGAWIFVIFCNHE